jgi:predicted MFS family arabinose efflux permease
MSPPCPSTGDDQSARHDRPLITAQAAQGSGAKQALSGAAAVTIFLCFAFAYFFSALARAVVATLAPALSSEFGLNAADLGLLAGAYFLGFASMQLPLGSALDRVGPMRVLLCSLSLAVIGCALFASARSFAGLTAARALIGMGVAACLMAPMTCYRHRFSPRAQMRAASWMFMIGSSGMVASTLPVQWLLPRMGWRGLFWLLAALFTIAMASIAWLVPRDAAPERSDQRAAVPETGGYRAVFSHRSFIRLLPMGFFHYGGLLALQSLWIGPWLSQVSGWTPQEAAAGLFALNVGMLVTFLAWGAVVPRLYARGWTAQSLIARGLPISLVTLALAVALGAQATAGIWTVFCVGSTLASLAQPAIGQAFAPALAGRALSAYNLVIFAGVFTLQWLIGGTIDLLHALGWSVPAAFQGAFALVAFSCIASYLWFLWFDDSDRRRPSTAARARSADNPPSCRES